MDLTPEIATLNKFGLIGVRALRQDVEKVSATGETEDSIRFEVSVENNQTTLSLTFFGRKFFKTLETGRGPRKSSTYGEFDQHLEEYLQARGAPSKTSKSGVKYFKLGNSWVSAKSLAHKINKEGDSVYRAGGRVVYSPTLTKLVSEIKSAISRDFTKLYIREIL